MKGKSKTCSFGATLPQMAVPETMKSTSPSWSCCTTSRSWPSVPLGKTRMVTAPPVASSASRRNVSPKTWSAVVPDAIECDRRRTSAPRSVRDRHPAAERRGAEAGQKRAPSDWHGRMIKAYGSRRSMRLEVLRVAVRVIAPSRC